MALPNEIDSETGKSPFFWQDEILQVMYWMQGEGFGDRITVNDLQKFLDAPAATLSDNLQQLIQKGLVTLAAADRYLLTEMGTREGGRRFADEFDGMLQQGHYECSDPNCDCHSGDQYAPCRATGHSHEHPHAN